MNITHHQLPSLNPLAGLGLAESIGRGSYRPSSEPTVAGLQRDQTVSVARIIEPVVIKDLRAMRDEERNTETPITVRAFSDAMQLLNFAHVVLDDLPRTILVPDGDGGIRIEWSRDDRSVRVIIPPRPEQPAYMYQRVGRNSDVKPFSRSSVIQTLRSIILAP
jgi:hypothetical protein